MINVAILNPSPGLYSQTFIEAHLRKIHANKFILRNGYLPTVNHENKEFYHPFLPIKLIHKTLEHFGIVEKNEFLSRKVLKYLKKNKIEVVLAEFGQTGAAVYKICDKANIPLVVHFHGADAYRDKYLLTYKDEYLKMFQVAKYIIVVSKHMRNHLKTLGAPEEKLILNTYGPADFFLDIHPNFNNLTITSVGRFVDKKAPYLTILAFQKVLEHFPTAQLNMVGDGDLLFSCKNMVASLKLDQSVNFLGVKNTTEIAALFEKSYCYVQHSIVSADNDTEGTPVSILEASASGLPIVATNHAGIPDVIKHNETGFIVDEGDIIKMSEYITLLLNDRSLAKKMGAQGKENIRTNFSMRRHIDLLNEILIKASNEK